MNEGTRSGKSTIRLLGISAERPTNGLYLYLYLQGQREKVHKAQWIKDRRVNLYVIVNPKSKE
jgi:hypothetical protein